MRALPATLTARVTGTIGRARTWLREHVAAVAARFRRTRQDERALTIPMLSIAPVGGPDVLHADEEPTARDEAMAFLAACGYRGNWHVRTMRAFRDLQDANMARAEADINGETLLSREGERAGITHAELFYGSDAVARRYASDELRMWWDANGGRMTVAEYRADLENGTGDSVRAERCAVAY